MRKAVLGALLNPAPSPRVLLGSVLPGFAERIWGKRIVLTGASSGVGRAAAMRLSRLGAELVLVARREEQLNEVREAILLEGGEAEVMLCDLSDPAEVDRLVDSIFTLWDYVDIVVNNAGRSIRRSAEESVGRFHDYERTMALNYFGPVRLVQGLLPSMLARRRGHIVNVATWGVPSGSMPNFTAYHSSKSALAAFGRTLNAEVAAKGVRVTTLNFPLVRTPMIAPTPEYRSLPAITPEQAAEWVVRAIRLKPVEVTPAYVNLLRAVSAFSPSLADSLVRRAGI
jgi:NAD(P)-dependent dehydrogenase (short-subunit alcohol dehydrogenase family)